MRIKDCDFDCFGCLWFWVIAYSSVRFGSRGAIDEEYIIKKRQHDYNDKRKKIYKMVFGILFLFY